MAKIPERRHSVRLTIPSQLSSPGQDRHQLRLLDLSPDGARVEHDHPFPDRCLCFLDLPPALGGAALQGEVVWSQEAGRKDVAEGEWVVSFQSGLRFSSLTVGQRAGLTAALDILRAAQEG